MHVYLICTIQVSIYTIYQCIVHIAHMYAPFLALPNRNMTARREGTNISHFHVILMKGGSHWFP